ncbi:EamA family transporter [Fulvimarina sp. MAC8]|uniref:DMT family transporter n=1 Tax=Fulvimarina sp. MAC8 TaxID=3162874 RepID=UPI0032EADD90
MNAKDFGLWLLLAWLWGSSFLAIGIGVTTMHPFSLVSARMVIGALFLLVVLGIRGGSLGLGVTGWATALVVGLSGNVAPFLLISYAEQSVPSGVAALIMGIAPVVTLTVAPLTHESEVLTRSKMIGAVIGFAGIVILVGPNAVEGVGGDLLPRLALTGAALCYAFTALFSRRFPYPNPLSMAAASVLIGAILITALTALTGTYSFSEISPESALAAIYLGAGPTALAALIYFTLIPRVGAGRLQQVNYVVPVLGLVLGVMFLGERPTWNAISAVPVILVAVWFVAGGPKKPATTDKMERHSS